jgi:hypothetical protein
MLCRQFFEASRDLWPMLWKDDRLRATVEICVKNGLRPLELDIIDPEEAYTNFFGLSHGSLWYSIPQEVDDYWRYSRQVPLHMDLFRPLKQNDLIAWHTLATCPAGALAVILNDVACKKKDSGTCLIT